MRRTTASCCQSFSPKYARHGPDDVEELRDDGRHPGEVRRAGSRPRRARRSRAPATVVSIGPGYISSTGGAKTRPTPAASVSASVAIEVARVGGEVFAHGPNCKGFTNTDTTVGVALAHGPPHERHVAGVQRAHRRHEADLRADDASPRDRLAKLRDRAHDLSHRDRAYVEVIRRPHPECRARARHRLRADGANGGARRRARAPRAARARTDARASEDAGCGGLARRR